MDNENQYHDEAGNLVMLKAQIEKDLPCSGACEICEVYTDLTKHEWIVLGDDGVVIACSLQENAVRPMPKRRLNHPLRFDNYVSYDGSGTRPKRLNRIKLEEALKQFEADNKALFLNTWELRVNPVSGSSSTNDEDWIDVRLSPLVDLEGRDNQWHYWDYTFSPEYAVRNEESDED